MRADVWCFVWLRQIYTLQVFGFWGYWSLMTFTRLSVCVWCSLWILKVIWGMLSFESFWLPFVSPLFESVVVVVSSLWISTFFSCLLYFPCDQNWTKLIFHLHFFFCPFFLVSTLNIVKVWCFLLLFFRSSHSSSSCSAHYSSVAVYFYLIHF